MYSLSVRGTGGSGKSLLCFSPKSPTKTKRTQGTITHPLLSGPSLALVGISGAKAIADDTFLCILNGYALVV
jgi:hypothetical protein